MSSNGIIEEDEEEEEQLQDSTHQEDEPEAEPASRRSTKLRASRGASEEEELVEEEEEEESDEDSELSDEDEDSDDAKQRKALQVDEKTRELTNAPLPEEIDNEEDVGLISDLQNSLAFFSRQAGANEDANFTKIHEDYEKLHKVFLVSRNNEKKLVKRCRDLTLELHANANKVQAALKLSQNDRSAISGLKKEVKKAWKMVEAGSEKEARAKEAINSMKSEIETLRKTVEAGGLSHTEKLTGSVNRQRQIEMDIGNDDSIRDLAAVYDNCDFNV
jgi:hypothetical protein